MTLQNQKRMYWTLRRSTSWFYNIVMGEWLTLDEQTAEKLFRSKFRCSYETFYSIVEAIKLRVSARDTRFRKAIEVDRKVAATLYYLAHGVTFDEAAEKMGFSGSTLRKWFYPIVDAILYEFNSMIRFPKGDALLAAMQRSEELFGIPGVIGSIDGSHIPIEEPRVYEFEYYNYKGFYSILLLAIVSPDGEFIAVSCKWPGRCGDQRAFTTTGLYWKIATGIHLPLSEPFIYDVAGTTMGPFLLGDSAFALERFMMKGFADSTTDRRQRAFNAWIKSIRSGVERAFGRLKERFRILYTKCSIGIGKYKSVVVACCILHNIIERARTPIDWDDQVEQQENNDLQACNASYVSNNSNYPKQMREAIIDFLTTR